MSEMSPAPNKIAMVTVTWDCESGVGHHSRVVIIGMDADDDVGARDYGTITAYYGDAGNVQLLSSNQPESAGAHLTELIADLKQSSTYDQGVTYHPGFVAWANAEVQCDDPDCTATGIEHFAERAELVAGRDEENN
jgi:hypothetical protein